MFYSEIDVTILWSASKLVSFHLAEKQAVNERVGRSVRKGDGPLRHRYGLYCQKKKNFLLYTYTLKTIVSEMIGWKSRK